MIACSLFQYSLVEDW